MALSGQQYMVLDRTAVHGTGQDCPGLLKTKVEYIHIRTILSSLFPFFSSLFCFCIYSLLVVGSDISIFTKLVLCISPSSVFVKLRLCIS